MQPALAAARPEDIARAAQILAQAERPVIFAQRGAGSPAGFATLAKLVEDWAIPVPLSRGSGNGTRTPEIPNGARTSARHAVVLQKDRVQEAVIANALGLFCSKVLSRAPPIYQICTRSFSGTNMPSALCTPNVS
jgi:thiamine pyrophosphate-dependent acetolactate synthase large subunit-like protein